MKIQFRGRLEAFVPDGNGKRVTISGGLGRGIQEARDPGRDYAKTPEEIEMEKLKRQLGAGQLSFHCPADFLKDVKLGAVFLITCELDQ